LFLHHITHFLTEPAQERILPTYRSDGHKKAMPFDEWHGFRYQYSLFAVCVDLLFVFIELIDKKAVNERCGIHRKNPNQHGEWTII
jgi:hypothetical protein